MFKIKAKPTFEATIEIPAAGAEPAQQLKLVFKHKTRKETADFYGWLPDTEGMTDGAVLGKIIEGWKDVDTEFSEDALTELCEQYHDAVAIILDCYARELNKARAKN